MNRTRIPTRRFPVARGNGEHAPLACGFRRRAENFVPQTFPPAKETKNSASKVRARRPNSHARDACAPHSQFAIRVEFDLQIYFPALGRPDFAANE